MLITRDSPQTHTHTHDQKSHNLPHTRVESLTAKGNSKGTGAKQARSSVALFRRYGDRDKDTQGQISRYKLRRVSSWAPASAQALCAIAVLVVPFALLCTNGGGRVYFYSQLLSAWEQVTSEGNVPPGAQLMRWASHVWRRYSHTPHFMEQAGKKESVLREKDCSLTGHKNSHLFHCLCKKKNKCQRHLKSPQIGTYILGSNNILVFGKCLAVLIIFFN